MILEKEEEATPGEVGLVAEAEGILAQLAKLKEALRSLSDGLVSLGGQ